MPDLIDALQDDELAKDDVRELERLAAERAPYEAVWREVDQRFPDAAGFTSQTPGAIRGERNFDPTHITSLERFAAAGVAITTPEERNYIKPSFSDPDLMKIPTVKAWADYAGRRMYAIRHAVHTGFAVSANEDWDQLGRYGTSAVWSEAIEGRGLIYRTINLSEIYIDVDAAGIVDTVYRRLTRNARQCEQLFGKDGLTPKMRKALDDNKPHTEFELLHAVRPNTSWDRDKMDWRGKPIASRYLALDEKQFLRRGGYWTSPISVSRHMTSPGEKYGRSPAIKMLPTINGVNAMRHTTLRAGHKAVDPALLFNDDDGITSIMTKPGGLNPGLVDDAGRVMVARMPGGEGALPWASQDIESERAQIRTAFLEEFYKLLTDPNSRMTTTEVLEVMAKQGVLVRPFAGRYAMEKQHPMSNRDLDMELRAGQIAMPPPEVREARMWPTISYENPLAQMARAESTGKTLRYIEGMGALAAIDPAAADAIDADAIAQGMAEEIGVKPEYVRSPEAIAARRQARAEAEQQAAGVEQLQGAAGAYLDLAKANNLSQAA